MGSSMRSVLRMAALIGAMATSSLASADDVTVTSPRNVPTTTGGSSVESSARLAEPQMETSITHKRLPNRPLLATGSVLFVGSYIPAVIGAAVSDRRGDEKMYIPVAGPWLALARGESESAGYKTLMVLDGAVQGLGALALVSSMFIPERKTKNWYLIGSNRKFQLTTHGMGMGAVGRF